VWNTTSSVPSLLMDSTNAYIFAGSGTPLEEVNLSTGMADYLVADSSGRCAASWLPPDHWLAPPPTPGAIPRPWVA
jgi:hypothetical protein